MMHYRAKPSGVWRVEFKDVRGSHCVLRDDLPSVVGFRRERVRIQLGILAAPLTIPLRDASTVIDVFKRFLVWEPGSYLPYRGFFSSSTPKDFDYFRLGRVDVLRLREMLGVKSRLPEHLFYDWRGYNRGTLSVKENGKQCPLLLLGTVHGLGSMERLHTLLRNGPEVSASGQAQSLQDQSAALKKFRAEKRALQKQCFPGRVMCLSQELAQALLPYIEHFKARGSILDSEAPEKRIF